MAEGRFAHLPPDDNPVLADIIHLEPVGIRVVVRQDLGAVEIHCKGPLERVTVCLAGNHGRELGRRLIAAVAELEQLEREGE